MDFLNNYSKITYQILATLLVSECLVPLMLYSCNNCNYITLNY